MENNLPRPQMLLIAFIQGLILLFLYRSVESNTWPGAYPIWLTPLATLALSLPTLTLLAITKTNAKAVLKWIIPFSLILTGLGIYIGLQQEPYEYINNSYAIFTFAFTGLIASFKGLMYIQQKAEGTAVSYSKLFKLSWRNFLIFSECWLFALIFWGILQLGASLFDVLKITIFKEVLQEDWFIIPTLSTAFGFGVIIFRNIIHTVDIIAKILQTLIKFLLPVLTLVSLGFLATLPFKGLDNLWDTGSGSLLVLWLQALTLFFINAVYQDESHIRPYGKFIHKFIFIGVALLPVYSLIASYGLWLRIEQYGWTIDRCWGVLICLILACFSFGYLQGIIQKRDNWIETLSWVNIRMGLVVLAAMLLVNSPLLNFQKIAANSQMAKLDAGDTSLDDFDFSYFKRSLGRQGYLSLQQIKADIESTNPDKALYISRLYKKKGSKEQEVSLDDFYKQITFWPEQQNFSEHLIAAVYKDETKNTWDKLFGKLFYFLSVDLNNDGLEELIVIEENNTWASAQMWQFIDNEWQSKRISLSNSNDIHLLKSAIKNNEISIVKPKWQDLKVGNMTLRVSAND